MVFILFCLDIVARGQLGYIWRPSVATNTQYEQIYYSRRVGILVFSYSLQIVRIQVFKAVKKLVNIIQRGCISLPYIDK